MEAARYQPHYTIADYERWEGDWELWHGVAVSMSPSPNHRHQLLLFELARQLGNQLHDAEGCHCHLVGEHDWRIDDDTVLRPDLMIVCEPVQGDFVESPPSLIVEIFSPSTALKDRTAKRAKYAQQGVKFYVMVEPEDGKVEALVLREGEYEVMTPTGSSYACTLHTGCDLNIPKQVTQ